MRSFAHRGLGAVACRNTCREPVDFRKVLPADSKRCIGLHGPEQQMNAFRLDRRSAALRGGTRSVIVPGTPPPAVILRLIGISSAGACPPRQHARGRIAVIKAWIDEAPWPTHWQRARADAARSKAVSYVERYARETRPLLSCHEDPQAIDLRGLLARRLSCLPSVFRCCHCEALLREGRRSQ